MNLLLDTQALLWALSEPERLPSNVGEALRARQNTVYVSAASTWELATKSSLGKIDLPFTDLEGTIDATGFTKLAITVGHTLRVRDLPHHHRDPFDRLLIAQALDEDLTLVAGDAAILRARCGRCGPENLSAPSFENRWTGRCLTMERSGADCLFPLTSLQHVRSCLVLRRTETLGRRKRLSIIHFSVLLFIDCPAYLLAYVEIKNDSNAPVFKVGAQIHSTIARSFIEIHDRSTPWKDQSRSKKIPRSPNASMNIRGVNCPHGRPRIVDYYHTPIVPVARLGICTHRRERSGSSNKQSDRRCNNTLGRIHGCWLLTLRRLSAEVRLGF